MMEKSKILLIFRLRPNFLFQIVQENWCLQSDRLSVLSLSPFRSKFDLNSVTMLTTLVGAHIRLHISTMVHPKNNFFLIHNFLQFTVGCSIDCTAPVLSYSSKWKLKNHKTEVTSTIRNSVHTDCGDFNAVQILGFLQILYFCFQRRFCCYEIQK